MKVEPYAASLKAFGEAIFAEWYPDWSDGDPMPTEPPARLIAEAQAIAGRQAQPKRPHLRLAASMA